MNEKTHLYRHFDAAHNLLYVGVTCDTEARKAAHKTSSHWFSDVDTIEFVEFSDRESALNAEIIAIIQDRPKWNVIGNPDAISGQPRNNSGKIITSFRMPEELLKAMKKKADSEFRSVNQMLVMVLTQHCKKELENETQK